MVATTEEVLSLRKEIQALQRELSEAREALLELPAAKYRLLLSSYADLRHGDRATGWIERVAEKIVETCTPPHDVGIDPKVTALRSLCPLCGEGGEHIYGEVGFVHPEGLRRHLTGDMNARLCQVMNAAKEQAREHLKSQKPDHG